MDLESFTGINQIKTSYFHVEENVITANHQQHNDFAFDQNNLFIKVGVKIVRVRSSGRDATARDLMVIKLVSHDR